MAAPLYTEQRHSCRVASRQACTVVTGVHHSLANNIVCQGLLSDCCVPPPAFAQRLCGQQAEGKARMTVRPNRKPAVDGWCSQAHPTTTPCTPATHLSPRPEGTHPFPPSSQAARFTLLSRMQRILTWLSPPHLPQHSLPQ